MTNVRFNLVCHGLMALWQGNSYTIEIHIPQEDEHSVMIGHPKVDGGAPFDGLSPLPESDHLRLCGVKQDCNMNAARLRDSFGGPVLHGRNFQPASRRSRIVAPMPWRVRTYRIAEVDGSKVEGDTTPHFFSKRADLLAEVTVLSWNATITEASDVYIHDETGGDSFEAKKSYSCDLNQLDPCCKCRSECRDDAARPGEPALSLCLYSQPTGPLQKVRRNDPGAHEDSRHGMSWNRMFTPVAGGKLDMHLALSEAIPDPPPCCTMIGVECERLLSLQELQAKSDEPGGPITERAGCGSACFCC